MDRYQVGTPASRPQGFRPAIMLLLCLASSSCYAYASLEKRSGATLEARIDGSDSEYLYVTPEDGPQQVVSRVDVLEISHPGKVRIAIGAVIAAAGAAALIYGQVHQWCAGGTRTPQEDCGFDVRPLVWTQLGALGLGSGVALTAAGLYAYVNSVTAAMASEFIPNRQAMQRSLPRFTCPGWPRCSPDLSLEARALSNMPLQQSVVPQ